MLDGPMWGLSPDQDKEVVFKVILCILRVPGIFFLDFWLENSSKMPVPASLEMEDLADVGANYLPLILAMCFLLLPLSELVNFYMHLVSSAALSLSVFSAYHFVADEIKMRNYYPGESPYGQDYLKRHATNGASFVSITWFIRWCLNITNPVFRQLCPQLYLIPVAASLCGANIMIVEYLTNTIHCFTALFVGVYSFRVVGNAILYVHIGFIDYGAIRNELGFGALVLLIRRMFEPSVLVVYWFVQLAAQIWWDVLALEEKKFIIQDSDWVVQCLVSLSEICYSPLMLIAFCIAVMAVSRFILTMTQTLLSSCSNVAGAGEPVVPSGITEGLVTFVLGLQTGLTDMEMPGRVGAVSIILFVVVASLLQSCLDITHPVLLSLPAVNRSVYKHVIPVCITLLLMIIPLWMVYSLLTKISSDLWTLVIISSCLVTAVQSIGHLSTYSIIAWDCAQPAPSPHTDDYIFWVKAATKFGELILAVAVVGGGFYESFALEDAKDWSMMNTLVLVSHCYFNIYTRVQQGWSSYLARRETSKRLSSLQVASETDLSNHGDVCSICYQEMQFPDAVITNCQHFFHTYCLKKWLVVQDNCPLCTKPIVASEEKEPEPESTSDLASDSEEDENAGDLQESLQMEESVEHQEITGEQSNYDLALRHLKMGNNNELRFRNTVSNQSSDLIEDE